MNHFVAEVIQKRGNSVKLKDKIRKYNGKEGVGLETENLEKGQVQF